MAKKPETVEMKTYILNLKDGNIRKITIPAHWKLTFGNLLPFTERGHQREYGIALRIYGESKDDLRAVMGDVVSIRDTSIEISEKRTTVQRRSAQKQTSQGAKDVVVEARVTEWINPDAEDEKPQTDNEFLKLTDPNTKEIPL